MCVFERLLFFYGRLKKAFDTLSSPDFFMRYPRDISWSPGKLSKPTLPSGILPSRPLQ